ncbi:MAG: hypothetical protein ACFB6R_12825 [Alphaproteobacteria bacterium]
MTEAFGAHPPRPGLALRVGVTGHRPNRETFAAARLFDVLKTCLAQIKTALEEVLTEDDARGDGRVFRQRPAHLKLISPLAQGTDTIAARAALDLDYDLQVPLPFSRSETAGDYTDEALAAFQDLLARASAVFELHGTRDREAASYEAVGLMTARQSDLMIVVWDTEDSQGRGGTFDILNRALNAGIPALWFLPHGEGPFLLFADPAASVDPRDLMIRAQSEGALPAEAVKALVTALVAPPGGTLHNLARHRLNDFFQETERCFPDRVYAWLLRALGLAAPWRPGPLPSYTALGEESWAPFDAALKAQAIHLPPGHERILKPRFAWAEGLATYYGAQARAAPLRRYGLTALAVALALGPVLFPQGWGGKGSMQPVLMTGVLTVVAGIILSRVRERRERWKDRWIDYRLLAEELRQLHFLSLSGSRSLEAQVPPAAIDRQPGPRWVNWYYRATVRELPLPHVSLDQDYLDSVAIVVRDGEIRAQADRFRARAGQLERLGRRLDRLGHGALVSTLILGLVYLLLVAGQERLFADASWADLARNLIILPAALLPILGAGLTALARHEAIETARDRARATADRLEHLWHSNGTRMTLPRVSHLTEDAARILMTDIADWRFLNRTKPLSLPTPDGGDTFRTPLR